MKKLFLIFLLSLFGFGGCATAPLSIIQVPMDYTPTNPVKPPRIIKDTPIYFSSFLDKRKSPDQIGENREKETPVPAQSSPQEVMSSLEKAFKQGFNRAGLNVVESQDKAQRIIVVTLQNLWVEEKNLFHAVVVANVQVKDRSGKVLASEGFKGTESRWGTSYNPVQYRKAISDAYLDMINNIFGNDAFMQKLL